MRTFLNLKTDADFVLVVAWALAALRDRGPYPVIVLSGEQGSGKSTISAVLRALLDPNTAPLRALPREDRDLFIADASGGIGRNCAPRAVLGIQIDATKQTWSF